MVTIILQITLILLIGNQTMPNSAYDPSLDKYVASARVTNYMKKKGLGNSGYTDENGNYFFKDDKGNLKKISKKNLPSWFNQNQTQAGE